MSKLFDSFDPRAARHARASARCTRARAARRPRGDREGAAPEHPGARSPTIIEFFRELATFLAAHTSAGARVDVVGVIQQLERALADELDYRIEARNAASFRKSLAEFPRLLVPKVIEAYTTERVLTTERVRGLKIDEVLAASRGSSTTSHRSPTS